MAINKYAKFIKDMKAAGYEVETDYHGRYYYQGPAITLSDHRFLQDAIRATKVKLQWDELGLGLIVYPA